MDEKIRNKYTYVHGTCFRFLFIYKDIHVGIELDLSIRNVYLSINIPTYSDYKISNVRSKYISNYASKCSYLLAIFSRLAVLPIVYSCRILYKHAVEFSC